MSETEDLINFYDRTASGGSKLALATVIKTDGPSYRSPGARSIICEDGNFRGGLSAGCLEGDVACRLDGDNVPFLVEYDLSTEDDMRGFPFGCGGSVEIFVEPLPSEEAIGALRWLSLLNEPAVMVTIVNNLTEKVELKKRTGSRFGVDLSQSNFYRTNAATGFDQYSEALSDAIVSTFACKKSKLAYIEIDGITVRIFAEYFEPATTVYIYGDGEDARLLETFANSVGMYVQRFSRNKIRVTSTLYSDYPAMKYAYNVIMTHDLNLDTEVLKQVLQASPAYLGVMGPRSRTERMIASLPLDVRSGLNETNLYAPIGLDVGAETPNEIALSIVAEIQTVSKKCTAKHLRNMNGAIHSRNFGQSKVGS
ncbi:MAG: XdhC family protein [Leptolyngbya sp.]|nr:XdhC family protein [Candidatus Melainabacteria bacterium]